MVKVDKRGVRRPVIYASEQIWTQHNCENTSLFEKCIQQLFDFAYSIDLNVIPIFVQAFGVVF